MEIDSNDSLSWTQKDYYDFYEDSHEKIDSSEEVIACES